MTMSRRQLLVGGAAGVGLAVGGSLPSLAEARPASTRPGPTRRTTGPAHPPFPPLRDDPHGIVALPEGFRYKIVSRTGVTTLDGGLGTTPTRQDGTAAFLMRSNKTRLITNHEQAAGSVDPVPHVAGTVYDPGARSAGGCTVVETDRDANRRGEWVGISGTVTNCAGGPTPWSTWLTCEETEVRAGTAWSGNGDSGTYAKDHGYVFEVFPSRNGQIPRPIKALGRFSHEAVAVDARENRIYLSEDASGPTGLFYRWTAPAGFTLGPGLANHLSDTAGTLEAMQILLDDGSVLPDVAYVTSAQLGRPFPVRWIAVPERDARTTSVRKQFTDGQVTRGKKFEGVYGTDAGIYVVNSYAFSDGDLPADAAKHDGMVWFYDYATQTIRLVTYFPHQATAETGAAARFDGLTFDGPDNVTVTPWGSLVLAEDGAGASHVLSAVPGGPTYAIARNQVNTGTDAEPVFSEFTGPTFSADGRWLYVNIQEPGITLAITGPWETYLG